MPPKTETTLLEFILNNPEFEYLFDQYSSKNNISIDKISIRNGTNKVEWYCSKHDYYWKAYVVNRVNHPTQMPCCREHLSDVYPGIAKDWHPTKNGDLKPNMIQPNAHKRIWWKCHKCGYEWNTHLHSRTYRQTSCPQCSMAQESRAEIIIREYFKKVFPKTIKTKIENTEFDIYIPELNMVIEYDGYEWHRTKRDKHIEKLEIAKRNNLLLINIAECKDNEEAIQEVKSRYTAEHIVMLYMVNSAYNIDNLLPEVVKFFRANNVKLPEPKSDDAQKIIEKQKSGERANSLWNVKPWIREWLSPHSIPIAKAYTSGSGEGKIQLLCPKCGKDFGEKPIHWYGRFTGCNIKKGGCGYTGDIPQSQLNKVREQYKESYIKSKDTKKQ